MSTENLKYGAPQIVNPPLQIVEGLPWFGFTAINFSTPLTLPAVRSKMRFQKQGARGVQVVQISTDDGQIAITDAAAWSFAIAQQIIAGLTPGQWRWQMTFEDANGPVPVMLQGDAEVYDKI
jgi:hypothetical protein